MLIMWSHFYFDAKKKKKINFVGERKKILLEHFLEKLSLGRTDRETNQKLIESFAQQLKLP